MSIRRGTGLFLLFAALFLFANRAAYRGYFQDDEIDNISWTPHLTAADWLQGFATPLYYPNNFRPSGHFYFHQLEAVAGLHFPVYVAVLEALHLLNVWLLWLIARRLGAGPLAAAAACLFFGVHMALFDNFWKPMYVFDVLCGTFSLAALLGWMHRRWVLSFLAFWLAYKSKELAVMLPLLLAAYEFWFGKRQWKALIPFFAASLSFGVQSMFRNHNADSDYAFRFTAAALARTAPFYAGRLFLVPYLGFAVALFAIVARNRRTWFGLLAMALFLFPMLFLPGRVFSAYCYLPLAGLAIALTGMPAAGIALLAALMLPLDNRELRRRSRATLAADDEVRVWMETLKPFVATHPDARAFDFSGAPAGFQQWGMEGALKYYYRRGDFVFGPGKDAVMLSWNPVSKRLEITAPAAPASPPGTSYSR